MNKNILIGSIIAVVILILVSFASVVGFQSVKSNYVKASPLFSIRTSITINEEQLALTSNYIGKENEIAISFPIRTNRMAIILKVIDKISKMDDITFNRFMKAIIHCINQDDIPRDIETQEIVNGLKQIRDSPQETHHYVYDEEAESITSGEICTYNGVWLPGCYIFNALIRIFLLTLIILYLLNYIITSQFDCII